MTKKLIIALALGTFLTGIAFGQALKTIMVKDIKVMNVTIANRDGSIDFSANYYFVDDNGNRIEELGTRNFTRWGMKISKLPGELKAALQVINNYARQEIIEEIKRNK